MELTEEILADDGLFAAWREGNQRVLHDDARDPAERVRAGCILAAFVTHTPGRPVAPWGTRPADLSSRLRAAWDTAFDDGAVLAERVEAALALYAGLAEKAAMEDEGGQILRRELET